MFKSNACTRSYLGVRQLIAHGNDLAQQLNTALHTTIIQGKEENQLREIHTWASE